MEKEEKKKKSEWLKGKKGDITSKTMRVEAEKLRQ